MSEYETTGPLKSTDEGKLVIGGIELACAVLTDGTRIISRNAIFKAFGRTKRGRAKNEVRVLNRPSFIDAKNLQPLISSELEGVLKLIEYEDKNGKPESGYNALILPNLCKVYLDARANINPETGRPYITKQQLPLARASEVLLLGLANVGIIALVDEATGHQDKRAKDALSKILEEFLLRENKPYIGAFPTDFYRQIYRLNNWQWKESNKRPGVIGRWTDDIIYERLAPGILQELKKKNPTIKPGKRKFKHFQFLTDEVGDPALKAHFDGILALQRASPNWSSFYRLLERAYPKFGTQLEIGYNDGKDNE